MLTNTRNMYNFSKDDPRKFVFYDRGQWNEGVNVRPGFGATGVPAWGIQPKAGDVIIKDQTPAWAYSGMEVKESWIGPDFLEIVKAS